MRAINCKSNGIKTSVGIVVSLIISLSLLPNEALAQDTKCSEPPNIPQVVITYSAIANSPKVTITPSLTGEKTESLWADVQLYSKDGSAHSKRTLDMVTTSANNPFALIWDSAEITNMDVQSFGLFVYAGNNCGSRGTTHLDGGSNKFPLELQLKYRDPKYVNSPIFFYNDIEQNTINTLPIPVDLFYVAPNFVISPRIVTPDVCSTENFQTTRNFLRVYPNKVGQCRIIISLNEKRFSSLETELLINFAKGLPLWTFQYGHFTLDITPKSVLSIAGLYYQSKPTDTKHFIKSQDSSICSISTDPFFKKDAEKGEMGYLIKFSRVGTCKIKYSHDETALYLGDSGVLNLKVVKGPVVVYKGFDYTFCKRVTRSLLELVAISKKPSKGRLSSCPAGFKPGQP